MAIPGRFGAVLTAMVTPFDDEGGVDLDGAQRLARWLVDNGNDGLILTGTTGEAPTMTDAERGELWRAVREAVTCPLVIGSTSNDTAHSIELTKDAEAAGADAILAMTPYYNRPSQAGVAAHFTAIAAASSLPVMLYDIPIRTGRKIDHDTMLDLARNLSNVVAVKDAAGDVAASARLCAEAPSGFELYSGEDKLTLALLAVGAVGLVGVATHWCGTETGEMIAAFAKGDVDTARDINARLIPSWAFESSDAAPNPVPSKCALRVLGQPGGACRLPMGPEPAGLADEARALLTDLGRTVGSA